MNYLEIVARQCRDLADYLDGCNAKLALPVQEISLDNAVSSLRAVIGAECFSITLDLHCGSSGRISMEWTVYNGTTGLKEHFFKSPTLAGAVSLALSGYTAPEADPLANAQQLLDAATEAPL